MQHTEWDTLQPLRRDTAVGPAAKLCFEWLWHYAGGRPGYLVVNCKMIAYELGRDRSSAANWLSALEKHGLIEIVDRDKRRGALHVYVYHPNPGDRPARPDPQGRLPFEAPDVSGAPEDTKPHDGATKQCRVFGGKPGTKTAETLENTANPPPACRVFSRKPGSLLGTNKNKDLTYQSTNEQFGTKNTNDTNSAQESTCARADGPVPIGAAVAEAIAATVDEVAHPLQQKRRLERRILNVVRDPKMGKYVAGKTADLVVFHDVPLRDLEKILGDVEAMRQAGTLRSAGAFFHMKVQQLAARYGVPWRKSKDESCATGKPR